MFSKTRSLSRLVATFGLALASMAACGVVAAAGASAANHWYVNGEQVGSTPVAVSGANEGVFTVGYTVGGISFKAECSKATTGGSISNPVGGGAGVLGSGSFALSSCTVKVPAGGGGCTVAPITFNPLNATLTAKGVQYVPASGETLFILKASGCYYSWFNGEKIVKGSMTSAASASKPGTYEFTTTSGSSLVWGGNAMTLTGKYNLATASGGVVTVAP